MKIYLSIFISLLIITSCNNRKPSMEHFIDTTLLDSSIKPTYDFFEYVNGKWVDKTKIPEDQTRWGSFVTLHVENQKKLKTILTDLEKNYATTKDANEKRLGTFFASGMDTSTIDSKGYEPIKPYLKEIDAIQTSEALLDYATKTEKEGLGFLFRYNIFADDKNSTINILNFYQGGINLPDRSYYLESKNAKIKEAYRAYITDLFTLVGKSKTEAASIANQIIALETKIAKTHKPIEKTRIPNENYNKVSPQELQKKLVPSLNWNSILSNMGLADAKEINVAQPAYYNALGKLLKELPLAHWKNKIKLDLLHSSSSYLSKDFRKARFDFVGKKLSGQQVEKPRWQIITNVINSSLGELLGQIYVKRHFSPEAKKRMDKLIDHLFVAYEKRIKNLDWMSEVTKEKALKKLNAIIRKIGYPDKWKSYDDINPAVDDYFGNILQSRKHIYKEELAKLGKPVDKSEWFMSPSQVNAYYNPSFNEIVFPAAILQFPFFDLTADDAINYGGIGMVIGHEITHGFDDQGKEYNADGNLAEWWTAEDEAKFTAKADIIKNQYSKYAVSENFNINGALTLGENIADLGGLAIAYDAFQMTEQAKKQEPIDGLTPNERFFMSYAQIWKMKVRPETEKLYINIDPHSPSKFRVNGPLTNFTPFYTTFGTDETSPYYKPEEERCIIW